MDAQLLPEHDFYLSTRSNFAIYNWTVRGICQFDRHSYVISVGIFNPCWATTVIREIIHKLQDIY